MTANGLSQYDDYIKFYSDESPPIVIVLLKPMLEVHKKCQFHNSVFINKFIEVFTKALENNDKIQLEIDAKIVFIADIQKNLNLIAELSKKLENKFPGTLNICNIHNAPSTFSSMLDLVSKYISQDVKDKIKVHSKSPHQNQ